MREICEQNISFNNEFEYIHKIQLVSLIKKCRDFFKKRNLYDSFTNKLYLLNDNEFMVMPFSDILNLLFECWQYFKITINKDNDDYIH